MAKQPFRYFCNVAIVTYTFVTSRWSSNVVLVQYFTDPFAELYFPGGEASLFSRIFCTSK